jgi:flagellar biosynthetic protein FlhB
MFSRDAALTAVRATLAFAAAVIAVAPVVVSVFDAAVGTGAVAPMAVAAWHGAWNVALAAALVGAAFGALDYGVQLANWRKKLRMTFEELKRDAKENDGDPHARGRRRALHRELSRGSLRRVKDAAFVVTNPTHVAIALEYRPPDVAVPRVLVRAADEGAARVRDLARSYGIPLIENVPLARLLYATAEVGAYIPQEHYVAVAEIVAALLKAGVLK